MHVPIGVAVDLVDQLKEQFFVAKRIEPELQFLITESSGLMDLLHSNFEELGRAEEKRLPAWFADFLHDVDRRLTRVVQLIERRDAKAKRTSAATRADSVAEAVA